MKKGLTLLVGILVSGGLLYYLIGQDLETLKNELADARYEYLGLMLPLFFLSMVTRGYRWRALLSYRTSVWHAFHIMNIGYLLSGIVSRIGEFARAWMMTRLTPPVKFFTALSSILAERILDVLSVLLLLGISLLVLDVPPEVSSAGGLLGILTLIAAAVMIYFAMHRETAHWILNLMLSWLPFLRRLNLAEWLDNILDGLSPLLNFRHAADVFFWNVLSWIFSIAANYVLMLVFFDEGSLIGVMLSMVMLAMAIAIPSVPGTLGPFEAAVVAGLWSANVIPSTEAPENAPAVAYGLTLHAITFASYVVMGAIGLWAEQLSLGQVRRAARQETP